MAAAKKTIINAGAKLTLDGAKEFKESMGEINRKLKASQAELNKVTAAYGKNEQNVETLTARKTHLTNAVKLNQKEQQRLNEELQRATEEYGENSREAQVLATKIANVEAKGIGLKRQLSEVTAALEEQERAVRGQRWTELGQKIEAAGKQMQAVGKRMQDVGKTMSLAVTTPVLALGTAAIAVAADFDNSMGAIQARTGMTANEVHALSKEFRAMALSGDYGAFTAREIAAAYADVAVRGQDAEHATELMRMSMVLATATGNGLGNAAYFLGNYLLKVGKDTSYAEKYLNLFTKGIANTGIGLSDLQNYVFRMTPAFEQFGASGETNIGILTRLYQAGIRGADLYSGMGTIMMELATRSGTAAGFLEYFGVALEDANGNARDNKDILFDLAATMSAYGDQTKMAAMVAEDMTQTQAVAWFEFMNLHEVIRDDVIPGFYEATDAAEGMGLAFEMAGIQQDGLIGTGQQVRATMEEIKLQIADHLMPHALRLAEAFSGLIQRFASLDEGTQRTIIKFAGVAAAIGPVLTIGGKLVSTVGGITTNFGMLISVIGGTTKAKAAFTAKFPLLTAAAVKTKAALLLLKKGYAGIGVALAAGTKALAAHIAAQKAMGVTSGVLKGALGGLKVAFLAVKKALIATGIGAVVVAIGVAVAVLSAGIAYLIARSNRLGETYQELTDETERLVERQNQLAESSANAAAQFQQNNNQIRDNSRHLRDLAESIEYLTNKQELSAGEMAMLERYIAELNESVPGLSLAFDEYTGALNMTADALDTYLRLAEKQATRDAQLQEYMRLREEATTLEREHMEVMTQREALEEQLNDGTNRRRADRRALEAAIQDLITAEEGYKEAMAANAEMQDALAESIDIYSQSLADLEQTQREAAASAAAMNDAEGSIDGVTNAAGRQIFTLEEWEKAQEDAVKKITQSYERYYRVAANAFRTVTEAAAISVTELTQNLQDNARAVEEWSKNIAILAERGVNQGLIQQLRDAGPEAAATVRELVNASDEELDALNYAFEENTRVALESMQRELDPTGVAQSAGELIDKVAEAILTNQSMEDALADQINTAFGALNNAIEDIDLPGVGKNTIRGYVDGIESMQGDVTQAGEDTGASYLDGLESELEINSPSRKTQKIAVYAGEGMVKGTKDIEPKVVDTARDLARAFINGIADTIQQTPDIDNAVRRQIEDMRQIADMAVMNAHFDSIGHEMANGVARGIQNGSGIVSNAAQNMINNALTAMRAAAAINSPSRKSMEIADHIGDGLIISMKAKGKELVEVCKKITDNVLDSLYIDPSGLVESAGSVLHSMQTAVPAMENHIRQAASSPTYASSVPAAPPSYTVNIHNPVIREESDIRKLAKAVKKELLGDTDDEGRIGGAILQP